MSKWCKYPTRKKRLKLNSKKRPTNYETILSIISKMKQKAKKPKRRLDIRVVFAKHESWEKLFKYEEDYLRKKIIEKNDNLCSWIVRKRDEWKPCVTFRLDVCDKKKRTFKNSQCCHGQRRGYYSSRRDLQNMYAGCANCNCYWYKDHDQGVVTHIIRTHWMETREQIISGQSKRKPRIPELLEINEALKKERSKYQ